VLDFESAFTLYDWFHFSFEFWRKTIPSIQSHEQEEARKFSEFTDLRSVDCMLCLGLIAKVQD